MRFAATVVAASALLALLLPTWGLCAVADEVVILGDENEKPPVNAKAYDPATADIKIDGVLFFRIRTPAIGYSVAEREVIVLKRLVAVMSSGRIPPVSVDAVRGKPTVYAGKYRIVTVYPVDVQAAGMPDAQILAEKWADGIYKGLLATAPSNCFGSAPFYQVAIGSQVFFRLMDAYVYESLRARGENVDRRLTGIASAFKPGLVSTLPVRDGGVSVLYDGRAIVTATPADARARTVGSTQALADAWANNLCRLMPAVAQG